MSILSKLVSRYRTIRYGQWNRTEVIPTVITEERNGRTQLTIESIHIDEPGNGASSRFLDDLPINKRIVFTGLVNTSLDQQLRERGFVIRENKDTGNGAMRHTASRQSFGLQPRLTKEQLEERISCESDDEFQATYGMSREEDERVALARWQEQQDIDAQFEASHKNGATCGSTFCPEADCIGDAYETISMENFKRDNPELFSENTNELETHVEVSDQDYSEELVETQRKRSDLEDLEESQPKIQRSRVNDLLPTADSELRKNLGMGL